MLRRFATLPNSCCLKFFIIMLLFSDPLIWSSRCYDVWSSLPHASLLDLNSFMSFGFRLNTSCMLLDLGFMRLGCWILSFSCYAAWSSLPPVMLLDLPSITFDLTFMVPRCLMVSTSCYGTEPSQQYVILLDGPYFVLWYLILPSRCYAAWSYLTRATFLTFPCFVAPCFLYHVSISKRVFMMPSLPLVMLLGLVLSSWCYAAWSLIPQTMLLDLPCLVLRCSMSFISDRVMLFAFVFMMLCRATLLGLSTYHALPRPECI